MPGSSSNGTNAIQGSSHQNAYHHPNYVLQQRGASGTANVAQGSAPISVVPNQLEANSSIHQRSSAPSSQHNGANVSKAMSDAASSSLQQKRTGQMT
jgi:hypothetical protein